MTNPVSLAGNATNITSTTTLYTGAGSIHNIFVSSVSGSPTIKISDGATTLVNTFTPVAATNYTFNFRFATSLVITVGATLDCCVGWGT